MKSRTWSAISLLCFLAAVFFWQKGNERRERDLEAAAAQSARLAAQQLASTTTVANAAGLLTRLPATVPLPGSAPATSAPAAVPAHLDPKFPHRLRNTSATLDELMQSKSALLLRNALIDTERADPLPIPPHLRAKDDPGAYLVQAKGLVGDEFRAELARQGAQPVSYIPNNAFLVRASADTARQLRMAPMIRAVLPFEPYYKLDPQLLALTLEADPPQDYGRLVVTAFPGDADQARAAFEELGVPVEAEQRSAFGPQFVVSSPASHVPLLASLSAVQLIEPWAPRVPMNDLSRALVGVATNTVTTTNHLGLTGTNIWVNVNDTAVWGQHPDLRNRVFGEASVLATDPTGHGTHVAGTIASSGANGPTGTNVPSGSLTNANFRGMAPGAKLFVLPVDLVDGPLISDTYLQETAARTNYQILGRTNALISNNSWGYPRQFEYNSAAATYDAATRDAVPDMPGPQSLLYVFAAGNSGDGNDIGSGGEPGTITSPGTAKNVITVGALEAPRFLTIEIVATNQITNIIDDEFVITNIVETNVVVLGETDSADEVAPFSSRGNVGIGYESEFGRFKPDLVGPGTFVVSTRSQEWQLSTFVTNSQVNLYPNQIIPAGELYNSSINVPTNAVRLIIEALRNSSSPTPFPDLPIYVGYGTFPDTNVVAPSMNRAVIPSPREGIYFYSIGNPTPTAVDCDVRVQVDIELDLGAYYTVLTNLNESLKPYYRVQNGTSASAATVSGLLALMQEFFETNNLPHSPALFKALLINGARSLSPQYSFEVRRAYNYQGWGLPNLTNSLPLGLTNAPAHTNAPVRWVDQSATNALATGEYHAYQVNLPTNATAGDLRVTLVWTDPPGNPLAAVKLVNDLDLVVREGTLETNNVYVGNDLATGVDYNQAVSTNEPPRFDRINNLENVFLRSPLTTNYTVYVLGRRVNVNAVTAHPTNIVQDYALVVSVTTTNGIDLKQTSSNTATNLAEINVVTNGVPLLYQRVGANSPLLNYPVGVSNQWHFYVFTNTYIPGSLLTNGPYVAFATFMPPNQSVPRNEEADIDLYVTRGDPGLLTLDPVSLAGAYKSLSTLGSELVTFDDGGDGEIFYIGVKSEDQMAAEYGFVGLSSEEPFGQQDENGNWVMRGMPVPNPIPDGSPVTPGAAFVFAVGTSPAKVGGVVVRNALRHESLGDLLGNLAYYRAFVVLNNHKSSSVTSNGFYAVSYDDRDLGIDPVTVPTDGPGSLNSFVGLSGSGLWTVTMIDNASGQTGAVEGLEIVFRPRVDLIEGAFITLEPNQFWTESVEVPADVSRLRAILSQMSAGPLQLFLRRDIPPTLTASDTNRVINAPGGEIMLDFSTFPPLIPAGTYWVGVYNPTGNRITAFLQVRLERNLLDIFKRNLIATNAVAIGDDVLTVASNELTSRLPIADLKVGLRLDHPRVSDLAIHLVSPAGTRVLLNENRGGITRTNVGYETVLSNYHHVALTYDQPTRTATLFLDGEVLQQRQCLDLTDRLDTRGHLYLGYRPSTNEAAQFLGGLDETDLYSRALAASEIRAIYKFGGAGKPTNGLVSLWPFDDLSGTDLMTNNPASIAGPILTPGRFAQALWFTELDGLPDVVFVTNRPSLDVGGGGFTLDAWINPYDLSEERPIAVWSTSTNATGVAFFIRPGSDTNLPPGELTARLIDRSGVTNEIFGGVESQGLILTNGVLTNLVFATFTDDTNLAHIPIKFGNPSTGPTIALTNRLISGFERIAANPLHRRCTPPAQVFLEDTNFWALTNGWLLLSGCSSVLRAPPMAHTGTNLLVLEDGHLRRWVHTVPGTEYRLQLVHRRQPLPPDGVAWYRGENNTANALGGGLNAAAVGELRYTNAMVNDGFLLVTNAAHLRVDDDPRLFASNQWTIELWFSLTNQLALTNPLTLGGPVALRQLASTTLSNALVNYGLRVDEGGAQLWYNDPAFAGDADSGHPSLELVNSWALPTPNTFHHLAGTLRQLNSNRVELKLYLDGELDRHVALRGALTNTVSYQDPPVPNPLLIGTNRLGTLDGSGTNNFNGILDELTFYRRALDADEVREIYLMHRLGKCPPPFAPSTLLTVGSGSRSVFNSDSHDWVTNSVTFLADTNLTRVDLQAIIPGALIDSVELTELAPRYFIPEEALKPLIGESPAGEWRLEITDRRLGITNFVDPRLISWQLDFIFAPTPFPLIALTNGVPSLGTLPAGQPRYFYVDVPTNVVHATNTLSASGGLNLWYNAGTLPTGDTTGGDVRFLTNSIDGRAVLATNGWWLANPDGSLANPVDASVPLVPGARYFLALSGGSVPTTYSLRVDFYPDAGRDLCSELTPLRFGAILSTNITPTNAVHYYCYTVGSNAVCTTFEVVPSGGDVNLYIRNARSTPPLLPAPDWADYNGENPGTNIERIVVNPRSKVPLFPGSWYLAVTSQATNEIAYTVRAVETTAYREVPLTANVPAVDTAVPADDTCSYFVFRVSDPVPAIEFELYNLTGRARLLAGLNQRPGPCDFLLYDEGTPDASARLLICANPYFPDLRGDWYLAVLDRELTNITFNVRARYPSFAIEPLAGGVTVTRAIAADPWGTGCGEQPFEFIVTPEATRTVFDLLPLTGNVDLYVRRGAVPNRAVYDYASALPNLLPDRITVRTNSEPVNLAPGPWYVTVVNRDPTSVIYSLRATNFTGDDPAGFLIDPQVRVEGDVVTLQWTALPGLRFAVQYVLSLPPSGAIPWATVPGTVTSATGLYTFVDDGSQTGGAAPMKFYRLVLVP